MNNKILGKIFFVIFIIYLIVFLSSSMGYYDSKLREQTILTDEAIERFEMDVKEGKEIQMEDYVVTVNTDYSNKISKVGYNISNKTSSLVEIALTKFFTYTSSFFS